MDNLNGLLSPWRLVIMVGFLLCLSDPATSDDECLPYCVLTLDCNTTKLDIKSPGYPSRYPQDTKLLWVIEAPSTCSQQLTVKDMDLAAGDKVRIGHDDEVYSIGTGDDVGSVINQTILFSNEHVTWITFTSDGDNATTRGFWLTMTPDQDGFEVSQTSSATTMKVSTELPLVDLQPAVYRRLGVSLPLAVGLVILAFTLGVCVVCCHRKRKRASVNARLSEARITLEMCENPMVTGQGDVNLNTRHVLPGVGPKSHYYEIGEGEYDVLFDTSAPTSPHVYQELSKIQRDDGSPRKRLNVCRDESKGRLSVELDDEFCELTNMIDEMLGEFTDGMSPVAASKHSPVGSSSLASVGSCDEQRLRANTADVPHTRRGRVLRSRSLIFESVHISPNQNTTLRPILQSRKYAISNPNINTVTPNLNLNLARSMSSLTKNLGYNQNEDDTYSELNFEIDSAYQPVGCARAASDLLVDKPAYAILEKDCREDMNPVYSGDVSEYGSWDKVDIVEHPIEQRPRAYTSVLPRRSGHYTALRSRSVLLNESFLPIATQRQLLNQVALKKQNARSHPNLKSGDTQVWTNLRKSSESLNKPICEFRSIPPSFVSNDRCVQEDVCYNGDDEDYNEIEGEDSIYQPLSRPPSIEDLTQLSGNPTTVGSFHLIPEAFGNHDDDADYNEIEDEYSSYQPLSRPTSIEDLTQLPHVDVVSGRNIASVGSFHFVPEASGNDEDNGDYNEIQNRESMYQPLSRSTSIEDLTNVRVLGEEGAPPLPPIQYEMNERSSRNRPTVDVVLGRELTTVGSFHLISTARRSDKLASSIPRRSQSDDSDYDELVMEGSAATNNQMNPGNLYIEILDNSQDVSGYVGPKDAACSNTGHSQQVLPSNDKRPPNHQPELSGTTQTADTAISNRGLDLNLSLQTEGALQNEPGSQSSFQRIMNPNRCSTLSGLYSSIGPDEGDDGDFIYNGITMSSSDDDDNHEYVSVDDVLR